jgi:DNA-binding NtrC family response regulator
MHLHDEGDFRVLVVDDERIIADSLALILNRSGFSAKAAYSGESAVLQAIEWQPTALISDVVMPGMSDIETAAAVLQALPECHVLLFSGHGTLDLRQQLGEYRFEILPKPVHPREVLERLTAFRAPQEHLCAHTAARCRRRSAITPKLKPNPDQCGTFAVYFPDFCILESGGLVRAEALRVEFPPTEMSGTLLSKK